MIATTKLAGIEMVQMSLKRLKFAALPPKPGKPGWTSAAPTRERREYTLLRR
jgi:hypothetical protein